MRFPRSLILVAVLIGICVWGWAGYVRADVISSEQLDPFTYVLYLTRQGSGIGLDPSHQPAHELVAKEFVQPLTGLRPWQGQAVSRTGTILSRFLFDVPEANGPFTIEAPYFSNGHTFKLADNQQQLKLTVDVSGRAVCNENGVCDSAGGEDDRNCSMDCRVRLTGAPSPSSSAVSTSGSGGSGIWSAVLLLAIGIGLGAVYWLYRKRTQTLGT